MAFANVECLVCERERDYLVANLLQSCYTEGPVMDTLLLLL